MGTQLNTQNAYQKIHQRIILPQSAFRLLHIDLALKFVFDFAFAGIDSQNPTCDVRELGGR